jgi:hypothetical protein
MSTQNLTSTNQLQTLSTNDPNSQYTLGQMIGIWVVVTLPMVLLNWVVPPIIIPYSPFHPGITYWLLIIARMAWQFVVALVITYRELGTLRWSAIRERTWLQPRVIPGRTSQIESSTGGWCLPFSSIT